MRDEKPAGHGMAAGLLRRACTAAGLTQARPVELADTTLSAIAACESGTRELAVPVLARMESLASLGSR